MLLTCVQTKSNKVRESIIYSAIESGIALFISFLVNTFVVGVFAVVFSRPDRDVVLCDPNNIDLRNVRSCSQSHACVRTSIYHAGRLATV